MKQTKIRQYALAALLTVIGVALNGAMPTVKGQKKSDPALPRGSRVDFDPVTPRSGKAGRDPFRKYEAPSLIVKKAGGVVSAPSLQERIEQYRAQKLSAMNAHVAAPKPTTAFLLSEVQVVGISRTPRGYAAIVEASPIKLAYVIYPGERFYDGQLVAIEDTRLVFRREIVYSDGKRERSVEMKPLRQLSNVDALAAAANKAAAPAEPAPPAPEVKSAEVKSDKPAPNKP
jgi:hypothetical protein